MKKYILTLAVLGTLATANAYAQSPSKTSASGAATTGTPVKKGGDKENFKEMDKDGDGKLSKVEVDGSDRKHLKKDFATIDTNADGFITKDELKAYKAAHKATKTK